MNDIPTANRDRVKPTNGVRIH